MNGQIQYDADGRNDGNGDLFSPRNAEAEIAKCWGQVGSVAGRHILHQDLKLIIIRSLVMMMPMIRTSPLFGQSNGGLNSVGVSQAASCK